MPPSFFSTVHYGKLKQPAITSALKRLPFYLPPQASLYAVYEQGGASLRDAGLQPHLHLVVMGVDEPQYQRLVKTLFRPLSNDIETQRLNGWRTADIVLRYLRGHKKNLVKGEHDTTVAWRRTIGVPSYIDVNFALRRAVRSINAREYKDITSKVRK